MIEEADGQRLDGQKQYSSMNRSSERGACNGAKVNVIRTLLLTTLKQQTRLLYYEFVSALSAMQEWKVESARRRNRHTIGRYGLRLLINVFSGFFFLRRTDARSIGR